jgi:hypothetical protein
MPNGSVLHGAVAALRPGRAGFAVLLIVGAPPSGKGNDFILANARSSRGKSLDMPLIAADDPSTQF